MLAEYKRLRLERLREDKPKYVTSGTMNVHTLERSNSKDAGNSTHRNKPNLSASQEYTDQRIPAKKEAEDFARQQLKKIRSMAIIKLAKNNQWASMKMLDFVVLKHYLKETDKFGNTALYYAAMNQNYDMCKFLLIKGSNPNVQCEMKNTPFHCAYINGRTQVVSLHEAHRFVREVQSRQTLSELIRQLPFPDGEHLRARHGGNSAH